MDIYPFFRICLCEILYLAGSLRWRLIDPRKPITSG
jgi:hypothetical protein